MRISLDTHGWLWSIAAPERLRKEARALLADRGNILYLSAASAWEISIKVGLGKLRLPSPPEQFVPERLERDRVEPLPIELAHALRVAALPPHHRDPFDRVLIAQAQIERLPILTADPQFEAYEVELVRARWPHPERSIHRASSWNAPCRSRPDVSATPSPSVSCGRS